MKKSYYILSEIEKIASKKSDSVKYWCRFKSCQAWTGEVVFLDNHFTLVKSYEAIVGLVNHNNKRFIELGKWSQTTSKQVTQIYNTMFPTYGRLLAKGGKLS